MFLKPVPRGLIYTTKKQKIYISLLLNVFFLLIRREYIFVSFFLLLMFWHNQRKKNPVWSIPQLRRKWIWRERRFLEILIFIMLQIQNYIYTLNCKLSLSAGELSASLRNQLAGLKDRVQQEYNRKSGNKSSLILFYSNSTIHTENA